MVEIDPLESIKDWKKLCIEGIPEYGIKPDIKTGRIIEEFENKIINNIPINWISVSDKKPKENEEVFIKMHLVRENIDLYDIGFFNYSKREKTLLCNKGNSRINPVTHWYPINENLLM